jgi:peptide-methionine (S)-S-oxide reductase
MQKFENATIGGGCFWCTEAVYQELKGVISVESGYAGGSKHDADYKSVCSGLTKHAEVIQITFDPKLISYQTILAVFFTVHDPTTLNQQGNDKGPQYRSVIFYHDEAQKATAETVLTEAQALWSGHIVTEISPLPIFYPAEAYHQNYFGNNPYQGYCSFIIAPKLKKFRAQWLDSTAG